MSPDDANAVELVSAAYRELWQTLGSKFPPEVFARMQKESDPFSVPEMDGVDTGTLRKHLLNLKELVERKRWNTPAVRERLRGDLAERTRGRQVAQVQQRATVAQTWPNYSIPVSGGRLARLSPDGRYVIATSINAPDSGPPGVYAYDLKTKHWLFTPTPEKENYHHPTVSRHGDELIFPLENFKYRRVPFINGKPVWDKVRSPSEEPATVVSENVVYLGLGFATIRRWDLANNAISVVKLGDRLKGNKRTRSVEPIAGTDLLQLLVEDSEQKTVYAEKLKVGPNGDVTVLETVGPWKTESEPTPLNVTWSPDGKHHLAWKQNLTSVSTIEPGSAAPRFLFSPKINGNYGGVADVAVNSQTSEAGILFTRYNLDTGLPPECWVEVVDMTTKVIKGKVPLPWYTDHVSFSPDGESLVTRQQAEVTVVNYRQYLKD